MNQKEVANQIVPLPSLKVEMNEKLKTDFIKFMTKLQKDLKKYQALFKILGNAEWPCDLSQIIKNAENESHPSYDLKLLLMFFIDRLGFKSVDIRTENNTNYWLASEYEPEELNNKSLTGTYIIQPE